MSQSSFKQRIYNAAHHRQRAAIFEKDRCLCLHEAALETGRDEEIRGAHNDAVEAFAKMLSAQEDAKRVWLDINSIDPNLRHIP